MARLALAVDFFDDYHKLESRIQKRVQTLAHEFTKLEARELSARKGIHLETYNGAKDPRARTLRIDDNHRGIVVDAGNETFILVRIGTHDKVDQWMARNRFAVNPATGALEIIDTVALAESTEKLAEQTPEPDKVPLYDHRRDRDFINLGIDEEKIPLLRILTNEDNLLIFASMLPPGQHEALIDLLGDESVETIYSRLAGRTDADDIDVDDLAAAVDAPASGSSFHVYTDDDQDELDEMLNAPLDKWRIYLHHTQRELAEKPTFNGPARVTGGPGTGKTVVALHRARYLADQLEDSASPQILFTTFTKNLAHAIETQLISLAGVDIKEKVSVSTADSFAYRVVQEAEGIRPKAIGDSEVRKRWEEVVDQEQPSEDIDAEFLRNEWEQVILAQGIQNRSDYFKAQRAGRGRPLNRRARAEVWKLVEVFLQELHRRNERSFLQLAEAATGYLNARTVKPYRHVIVDEAQDLHEAQWKMLRAAVPEEPNDMFIVGDTHQRIYDRRASLGSIGINIVGRSYKLRINYRTTAEILRWSLALLGVEPFEDLEDGEARLSSTNYLSHLHGLPPEIFGAPHAHQQIEALITRLRQWVDEGINEDEIAVIARNSWELDSIATELRKAGLDAVVLDSDHTDADGIRLGTMHRMKGLEFRAVALVNIDATRVPDRRVIDVATSDPVQRARDIQRERCLLYVAATRARDDLWISYSGKPSPFIEPLLTQ